MMMTLSWEDLFLNFVSQPKHFSTLTKSIFTVDSLLSGGEHYNNFLEEEGDRSGLLGHTHHNISKQWDIHIPSLLPEKTKISDLDRVQCEPLFLFSCKCANSSLEQHCTSKYVNSLCPSPSKFMYFS